MELGKVWLWKLPKLHLKTKVRQFLGQTLCTKEIVTEKLGGKPVISPPFTARKMKFSIKDFFSKWPNQLETADLVTFTEEVPKENFIFSAVIVHHYSWISAWYANGECLNSNRVITTSFEWKRVDQELWDALHVLDPIVQF